MKRKIVMAYPYISKGVYKEVEKTLKSRWIGQAHKVDLLEKKIEEMFGDYAVAVNSGTSALELAYDLVGIKKGDEVITTALTCTATNIPLVRRGCKLKFVDIDVKTLNIDPKEIEKKITKKTKAIVITNLGGIKVGSFNSKGIPVIADSAQAFGVQNGDYTIYSFQAIKHITTGDGGMLMCKKKEDAKKAKLWRWFGIDRTKKLENNWQPCKGRKILFDIEYPGYKFQMNDIAASIGLANLKDWDKISNCYKDLSDMYYAELVKIDIDVLRGESSTPWLCTILVKNRESLVNYLSEHGIESNVMQIRNDLYTIFKKYKRKLPNLDLIENKYLCLPLHMKLTKKDIKYIVKTIKKWKQSQ